MILHTLIAIVDVQEMKIREFASWENQPKKSKKIEILKIFEIVSDF